MVNQTYDYEIVEGMRVLWDATVPLEDGGEVTADVFLPDEDGEFPLVMVVTTYSKSLPFSQGYPQMWEHTVKYAPEVLEGSTTRYISFEAPDPERWTAHGYGLMIVDARGSGRSPGVLNTTSREEAYDYYQAIEWAASQPWCTGKIGMLGMSYLGMMQWWIASQQPPHLTAIVPQEAANDTLRSFGYHNGVPCDFLDGWYTAQISIIQNGLGSRGYRNEFTGVLVSGDEDLSDEKLEANREAKSVARFSAEHPLDGPWYDGRGADWSKITIPVFSIGSWGAVDVHTRGNTEGFLCAASSHKWLMMRQTDNFAGVYSQFPLQKRFLDWALKGEGDWAETQPPVLLGIRHADDEHVFRAEQEWPLARTAWTRYYLHLADASLSPDPPTTSESAGYEPFGDGLTLTTAPMAEQTEVTGPITCKLWISIETTDADVFLVLRLFDSDAQEVLFQGNADPMVPVTKGWLRASRRALDTGRSLPFRPFLALTKEEPLEPGKIYELDIEIISTSIVVPPEYSLGLSVYGRDYDHGMPSTFGKWGEKRVHGSSLYTHKQIDERRSAEIYNGRVTVHSSPKSPSYLTLPVIPTA